MWRSLCSLPLIAFTAMAVDYESEVRPLLAKRCVGCHGPALQMSHLRLDQKASVLKGGESGIPAIEPGSAAKSLLGTGPSRRTASVVDLSEPPKYGERLVTPVAQAAADAAGAEDAGADTAGDEGDSSRRD